MFCRKCGAQNEDGAKFCKKCGERLEEVVFETQQAGTSKVEHSGTKSGKKKIGTVIAVIVALILIMAALVMVAFFIRKVTKEKQYAGAMDRGQRYMEELDYEKAEAEFLTALSIDPKDPKPYLALADVYLAQDEPEKAIEILEQATENVLEDVQKKDPENNIEEKLEEIKDLEKYTWVVEPEIEADDIFYIQNRNWELSLNEQDVQLIGKYAIIEKDGSLGLIDMDGKLNGGMDYSSIVPFGYEEKLLLYRKEPIYTKEFKKEWSQFLFDGDSINPVQGLGGSNFSYVYYAENGEIKLFDEEEVLRHESGNRTAPGCAIPVSEAHVTQNDTKSEEFLHPKYAVCFRDKLISEFLYDECGPESSELLAVKQNGKWGYINNKGEIVIPFEYEESWNYEQIVETTHVTYKMKYCYAASDGYVTLCKDGKWELRNTKGSLVIMPGVFEKICPVYDGKCWVKRNGKWGVIALEGREKSKSSDEKKSASEIEKIEKKEEIDTKSPFNQDYWVIFTEGYRDDRVEASSINSSLSQDSIHIIWDSALYLNDTSGSDSCDQYFLDDNDEWCQIGTYSRLSDKATHVIASNLDIYDASGNLILPKCSYDEIDWEQVNNYR